MGISYDNKNHTEYCALKCTLQNHHLIGGYLDSKQHAHRLQCDNWALTFTLLLAMYNSSISTNTRKPKLITFGGSKLEGRRLCIDKRYLESIWIIILLKKIRYMERDMSFDHTIEKTSVLWHLKNGLEWAVLWLKTTTTI